MINKSLNSKKQTTPPRINAQQAHDLALAFVSDISDYIRAHEAEYLAYLERTGQTDESYQSTSELAKSSERQQGDACHDDRGS